jgi:hypothetical protein
MKCVGLISLGATNGIGGVVCQSSARIIPDCLIFVAWKMYCLLIICLLTLEHDGAEMRILQVTAALEWIHSYTRSHLNSQHQQIGLKMFGDDW